MLGRLHRTDVERLVMSYEIFRNAIQREIERRMKEMIIKEAQQHQHHNFQAPPPTKYVPKGAAIFKDIKSGAIVSIGEPVVPAMPSALSKSTSQPMQLNNLYNNFAHQHHLLHYQQQQQQQQHQLHHQNMPPPPAQFSSSSQPVMSTTASSTAVVVGGGGGSGPVVKSASQPTAAPSLSSIHSVPTTNSMSNLPRATMLTHSQSGQACAASAGCGVGGGQHQLLQHQQHHHHHAHQLPLGKTISSTSMTSGHGSILESSSSTSSLFSLSGSHPYLATSSSSIHSSSSSLAPPVTSNSATLATNGPVSQSLVHHQQQPPTPAAIGHGGGLVTLFSPEEETKV